MLISDWSSDVCSSDLWLAYCLNQVPHIVMEDRCAGRPGPLLVLYPQLKGLIRFRLQLWIAADDPAPSHRCDRKSVVSGTSVSGRVDLGGSRIIKKHTLKITMEYRQIMKRTEEK